MSRRPSPTLIGSFVLGALALVVLAVVTFGSGRLFRQTRQFVLYFRGSVNGLDKGAPVKFRGVSIGAVTDVLLALPAKTGETRIPVLIEIDEDRMDELGASRALVVDAGMLHQLVERGLRAQLQLQSFITGVLFIALDLFPGTPVDLVLPAEAGYQEIPTLPTAFEQAQAKIQDILERLSRIDFEAFAKSLNGAIDGVSRLVNSDELHAAIVSLDEALRQVRAVAATLDARVGPLASSVDGTAERLRTSLSRVDASLARVDMLTDPHAPVVDGVTTTLGELTAAARSVRALADDLRRNPSALLTGRKAP